MCELGIGRAGSLKSLPFWSASLLQKMSSLLSLLLRVPVFIALFLLELACSDLVCYSVLCLKDGVAATFLPTRHPISPVIAPPLTISWTSAEHSHYVPLIPALKRDDIFPRVKLPQVAFQKSIPPGTEVEDYFQYRVPSMMAECMIEVMAGEKSHRVGARIVAGHDILEHTLGIANKLALSRERVASITAFLIEVAGAHTVPVFLSDSSWRILQDLNAVGMFPVRTLATPPISDFSQMKELMKSTLASSEKKLSPEQEELLEHLFTSTPTLFCGEAAPFALLLELLPSFPKPAILLGFLHCFLAVTPIHIMYPIVKECKIPQQLVGLVTATTPTPVMAILLRCFATLLNPRFGLLSFSIIHNAELRLQLRNLIKTLPKLHFVSLSAFLHNYAVFISHTQLLSHRVRKYHFNTLIIPFLDRCKNELTGMEEKDQIPAVVDSLLIAIGNVLLAQPELAPETQDRLLALLDALNAIPLRPTLVADLKVLLAKKPRVNTIPRVNGLLAD